MSGVDAHFFAGRNVLQQPADDAARDRFWQLDALGFLAGKGECAHPRSSRARIDNVHLDSARKFGFVGVGAKQRLECRLGRSISTPERSRSGADGGCQRNHVSALGALQEWVECVVLSLSHPSVCQNYLKIILSLRLYGCKTNWRRRKFGHPDSLLRDFDHWVVLLRPGQVTLGSLVLAAKSDAMAFGALPPEAHAVPVDGRRPLRLRSPEGLVRELWDAIADTLVRTPAAVHATGARAFAAAEPVEVGELAGWLSETDRGLDAGAQVQLRVELPVKEEEPFTAVVQVRSMADPSLVVDAGARGVVPEGVLTGRDGPLSSVRVVLC